jgi:superfamily II RNA helicase
LKESQFTGEEIYNQIKKLSEELDQLAYACDEVERNTLPHRLLKEAYDEKKRELQTAKRAVFTA